MLCCLMPLRSHMLLFVVLFQLSCCAVLLCALFACLLVVVSAGTIADRCLDCVSVCYDCMFMVCVTVVV